MFSMEIRQRGDLKRERGRGEGRRTALDEAVPAVDVLSLGADAVEVAFLEGFAQRPDVDEAVGVLADENVLVDAFV